MIKKLQAVFVAIVFFSGAAVAQTFYTVDNRPGFPANYHTLQGALDSVPAGSVLLLQGSNTNYGVGDLKKPVAIFGAGYFFGQNNAPSTQAVPNRSLVIELVIHKDALGSIISGLTFTETQNGAIQRFNLDSAANIDISRCYFDYVPFGGVSHTRMFAISNSSNINIHQCYFNLSENIMTLVKSSGISFSNNIFVGGTTTIGIILNPQAPYSYSFSNNSMYVPLREVDFSGGSYSNNIIIQSNTGTPLIIDAGMAFSSHNVSNTNMFPAGNNNIFNADGANTYISFSNPAIGSQDGIWQLKPGSPAIGFATDGGDCGAYGTTTPYVLSGIPAIPNIYFANTQQSATSAGGLKVHLKIKANN